MKIIAIIPARENSKRIKKKNLIKINGKPILKILFETLKKTRLIDKIVITSESKQICNLANKIGFDYIINRPKYLSKDHVGTAEVVNHSINFLEKKYNFTNILCVYPLSILIKKKDLLFSINNYKKNFFFFPVIKYSHPIQRALTLNKKNNLEYLNPKNIVKLQTQLFKEHFYDSGQFYLGDKWAWKHSDTCKKSGFEISNLKAVDVDNPEDLNLLKILWKFQSKTV